MPRSEPAAAPHADEHLNRAIGPWSLGANAVNLSVGAGIFALPAAEDGMLRASLGAVHPKYRTPHVAIATYAAASCLLSISGGFRPLAVIASVSLLLVYLAVCLAALRLRVTRDLPAGAFRAPGGPIVPVLGALTVIGLLAQITRAEMIGIGIALAVAAMYYVVRRMVNPAASGADYRAAEESDPGCPP